MRGHISGTNYIVQAKKGKRKAKKYKVKNNEAQMQGTRGRVRVCKRRGVGYNRAMGFKVAIVIERADIVSGGDRRSAFELASALGTAGHEVEILAGKGQTQARHIHILCAGDGGRRVRSVSYTHLTLPTN